MNKRAGMMSLLTSVVLATQVTGAADAKKIAIDGSTTVGPIAKAFAEYYGKLHPDVIVTVSESGSGNGAKSLINGACDVATLSRPMKPNEKKAAQDAGILPIETIIAMDGIGMIVHPRNPTAGLTVEQVRKIYTGQIANWKEVGGPDLPIVVISRDTNSGTYEAFETLVMNKEKLTPRSEYVGSNGAIRQRVLNTPAAIGYVGLAFLEGVKPLTVNGVAVNEDTVADKTYPICRPLYLYTNGRPQSGTALNDFVTLAATPDGKRIIKNTGYVPLPDAKK